MTPSDVRVLQVEATTKCNAWCPGCGRNNGGFGLSEGLVIEDLDSSIFQSFLSQMPNLEVIDFCGTYGDAIAASNVIELTEIAKNHAKNIMVRTNGSLRTTQWWVDYASILKGTDHEVWFCLDGLSDTHSIYRQGTDFDTIIANAKAFIGAGGNAVWQFIPWGHNQHQIKDCIVLSQQLNFKRFEFVKNVRKNFTPRHYRTGQVIEMVPWESSRLTNKYDVERPIITQENCRHLTQPSVYLNASGKISACCFFNTSTCSDDFNGLPDIKTELNDAPRPRCLHHCGTYDIQN